MSQRDRDRPEDYDGKWDPEVDIDEDLYDWDPEVDDREDDTPQDAAVPQDALVFDAHGDPIPSPWVSEFPDYLGRVIRITVNFNDTTGALISAVIHRDTGCLWHRITFDDPGDNQKAKRLAAPNDGQGDRTYTANQMASQGLTTITEARAVQITAEP